jgi:hypothetical protein
VDPGNLTEPERALWRAFPRGDAVDLSGARRTVRAEVIARLLLSAVQSEPGTVAAVRLHGARVKGPLRLAYADIPWPVRLRSCEFDDVIDLSGAHTRQLNLRGSRLVGLEAPGAEIGGNLRLIGGRCDGQIRLSGTHITGALQMQQAQLANPGATALLANLLVVNDDLLAQELAVEGGLQISGARVGGMVGLNGASLHNPGGRALNAFSLSVGGMLWARQGFAATGEVALSDASIGRELDMSGACLHNPGGDALLAREIKVGSSLGLGGGFSARGVIRLTGAEIGGSILLDGARLVNPGGDALRGRHVHARELFLRPEVEGAVDLRHARFDVILDDPARWPAELRLSGLGYDTLEPQLPAAQRVRWLLRDPDGYLPQNYETLAAMYRRLGDDAGARTVLLARERRRRQHLPWYSRAWSYLQEVTVGYGYRPLRAVGWLAGLAAVGTLVFGLHHPPPLSRSGVPAFNPLIYTLDLMVPVVDLGQKNAYDPQGVQRWLAYALIASGWLFVTTIAAGITRVLRRE